MVFFQFLFCYFSFNLEKFKNFKDINDDDKCYGECLVGNKDEKQVESLIPTDVDAIFQEQLLNKLHNSSTSKTIRHMWLENIEKFSNISYIKFQNSSETERGRLSWGSECFFNVAVTSSAVSKNQIYQISNFKLIFFWGLFFLYELSQRNFNFCLKILE
jgi:hypothetical protein